MRVDLYTNPHKEQREMLYTLAIEAGKIDYADEKSFAKLHSGFNGLLADLSQHVRAEEAFVHPLYLAKAPSLTDPLHQEHEEIELSLNQLTVQMQRMHNEKIIDKRHEMGLAFYRNFNRFICQYLEHIDEEERMLPFLWEVYNDEDLMLCMMTYKASIGIDEAMQSVLSAFPSQDKVIQQRLLKGFKQNASAERFVQFHSQLNKILPDLGIFEV